MSTCYDIDHDHESISSELLDDIEKYIGRRVSIDEDGAPNEAMKLILRIEDERAVIHEIYSTDQVPHE
jgi:hypothetical protein